MQKGLLVKAINKTLHVEVTHFLSHQKVNPTLFIQLTIKYQPVMVEAFL